LTLTGEKTFFICNCLMCSEWLTATPLQL
jgi:hypothetical protein